MQAFIRHASGITIVNHLRNAKKLKLQLMTQEIYVLQIQIVNIK